MILVGVVFGGVTDGIAAFTWSIILTGWISLFTGAVIAWLSRSSKSSSPSSSAVDVSRTLKFHLFFTAMFAVYIYTRVLAALPLIQAAGGWSAIIDVGGESYRNASLEQSLSESRADLSAGLLEAAINYITFILGMLSVYTGAVLWIASRRLIALLPVALNGLLSVATFQRTSLIFAVLLFVSAIWVLTQSRITLTNTMSGMRRRKPPVKPKRIRATIASIVLLAVVSTFVLITTNARTNSPRQKGILDAFSGYIVGGLAGLNARSAAGPEWAPIPSDTTPGIFDPSPGGGGYSFTGLWTVLARLGFPVEPTSVNLNFIAVTIFGERRTTNVVSALGVFYLDFGIWGVVAVPLIVGFIATSLQARLILTGNVTYVPALAFLMTFVFWSFFGAWSTDLRQLLVAAIGGAVFGRVIRSRRSNGSRESTSQAWSPAVARHFHSDDARV